MHLSLLLYNAKCISQVQSFSVHQKRMPTLNALDIFQEYNVNGLIVKCQIRFKMSKQKAHFGKGTWMPASASSHQLFGFQICVCVCVCGVLFQPLPGDGRD